MQTPACWDQDPPTPFQESDLLVHKSANIHQGQPPLTTLPKSPLKQLMAGMSCRLWHKMLTPYEYRARLHDSSE